MGKHILVIKSFTAERFESQRVKEVSAEYQMSNCKAIQLSSIYVPLIRMAIATRRQPGIAQPDDLVPT